MVCSVHVLHFETLELEDDTVLPGSGYKFAVGFAWLTRGLTT